MELQGPVETEEKINHLAEEVLAKLPVAFRGSAEPVVFPPNPETRNLPGAELSGREEPSDQLCAQTPDPLGSPASQSLLFHLTRFLGPLCSVLTAFPLQKGIP